MRTRAQAADGSDLIADTQYIAKCFDISEGDVKNLLNNPTADGAKTFIDAAIHKAQDFEKVKSEKLRVEVEFEHAVRNSENKAKTQKATITKHTEELKATKAQLTEANTKVDNLTHELDTLQAASSGSTAEVGALRSRIDTLEASNLDLKNLLESRANEKDRLHAEVKEQHEKLVTLRREVSSLEERNQALENAASSQKFKDQGVQQEIAQLKQQAEWQASELETRTADHTKYRKERNARLAELERDLEDSTTTVDNLKRSESSLRKRLDEMQTKAEEAFARINTLQEENATNDRNLREDIASNQRLVELHEQNASTHKSRVQELEKELESQRQDYTKELGQLMADIDEENAGKNDAYNKVADLEIKVKDLEQQLQDMIRTPRPTSVANRRMSSNFQTPGGPSPRKLKATTLPSQSPIRFEARGSTTGTPMNKRLGRPQHELSWQQISDQNRSLTEELAAEGRRCTRLQHSLEEVMQELESRKPDLEKMRIEQERLENEVYQYSVAVDEANKARDEAKKSEARWKDEASGFARQSEIRAQQCRDHCAQIKLLVTEQIRREQGMAEPTFEESVALERYAHGDVDEPTLDIMDPANANRFVTENLVAFRTAVQMQDKNSKLLQAVRDAAAKIDELEAEKRRRTEEDGESQEQLKQQVENYRGQCEDLVTTIESYVKERNMYRRVLKSRGRLPEGVSEVELQSLFGQSAAPATPGPQMANSQAEQAVPQSPATAQAAQAAAEAQAQVLKEQTIAFDNFRENAYKEMREKEEALKAQMSNLQSELTKSQGQIYAAEGRSEVHASNYKALYIEHADLRKKNDKLQINNKDLDFKAIALTEEVVELKSNMSNLEQKIETMKDQQKSLESAKQSAINDLERIRTEREQWQEKIQSVERLANERNLQQEDAKREMSEKIKALDGELQNTKTEHWDIATALREKTEALHNAKERFRERCDEMMKTIDPLRQQISNFDGVKAEKQARIDELTAQLADAQDKLGHFYPKQAEWDAEEQRRAELLELKTKLQYAEEDLKRSRESYSQMNQIAKQTQEDLDALNETSEIYREDADEMIATKDSRIAELEQRITDVTTELTKVSSELSDLKEQQEDETRDFAQQKASFEARIAKLEDDASKFNEERHAFVEDLKAQAEISRQAQTHYEEELVRHAEATQSFNATKKEYAELREKTHEFRVAAMSAKDELDTAKNAWETQQEELETQLRDTRMRKDSADDHINSLHEQLKKYASELETIRQHRLNSLAGGPISAYQHDESGMQEVINYLRREKEILQVNHDREKRNASDYRYQLQYAKDEMEKAREKLREEIRINDAKVSDPTVFAQLEECLRELNTHRESSVHLRDEARKTREKLDIREKELAKLREELEPLKVKVFELETNMEYKDQDLRLTTDDKNHWRDRCHKLMNKHGMVDAEEVGRLNQQISDLEAEKERLENERAPLQERITASEARLEAEVAPLREQIEGFDAKLATAVQEATAKHSDMLTKFKAQAKDQNRKQNERLTEMRGNLEAANASVATANAAREEAEGKLAAKVQEFEQAKTELEATKTKADGGDGAEEGEVNEGAEGDHATLHARIAAAEQHASNHSQRAENLAGEVQTLQTHVQELEGQVSQLQGQVTQLQGELETARSASANAQTDATPDANDNESAEALDAARTQLQAAKQELETLRANATPVGTTIADAAPAEGEKSVADQVVEEVAKLRQEMEAQHQEAIKQVEHNRDERLQKMKETLRERMKDERVKIRETLTQELQAGHAAEIEKLREEHDATIAKMKEEHAAAVEKLRVDFETEHDRVTKAAAEASGQAGGSTQQASDGSEAKATAITALGDSELTDEQSKELLKSSPYIRTVIQNNVKKHAETHCQRIAELQAEREQLAAEKDAKIAKLDEKIKNTENAGEVVSLRQQLETATRERDELKTQLEKLSKEKQQALMESKKKDVFVTMGRNATAKWSALEAAAKESPEQALKAAMDAAKAAKALPSQKPTPATPASASKAVPPNATPAAAPSQVKQEPNGAEDKAKGTVTNDEQLNVQSPAPATATRQPMQRPQSHGPSQDVQPNQQAQLQQQPAQQPSLTTEAQKMQERAARFGAVKQPSPTTATGSFGKPSTGLPAKPQQQGSFGQPSGNAQAGKNLSASAFSFTGPATGPAAIGQQQQQNLGAGGRGGSGLPQPSGGSRLPGPANRGGRGIAANHKDNASGMTIAGAANRGGANASTLTRGGMQQQRGRGNLRGNTAANAGQKRSNPSEQTGDEKRVRGNEGAMTGGQNENADG